MLFFWWKKYEDSWVATQISFVGTLIVTMGSIATMGMLASIPAFPEWLAIVIMIALFFTLKALLNRLTDRIANKVVEKRIAKQKSQPVSINIPLQIPASLTIIRDSSFVAALVPTRISLNGVQVVALKNGESATIPLQMSHNVLYTGFTGSKNTRYEFDVQDGAKGEIHVSGGVFKIKNVVWK